MSVNRCEDSPGNTLQLQLLGCGGAAGGSEVSASGHSSNVRGGTCARSSVGLQELSLECTGQLSDDELAAAAAALPDLRRLEVGSYCDLSHSMLRGLVGMVWRLSAPDGGCMISRCGALRSWGVNSWSCSCRGSAVLPAYWSRTALEWTAGMWGSCRQHSGTSTAATCGQNWCTSMDGLIMNNISIKQKSCTFVAEHCCSLGASQHVSTCGCTFY